MARSRLPKITRPVLARISFRTRLFRRLDALARSNAVIWLSAAAGSGKTILAASYLAQRKQRCLWYQIDERDADPSAFFFYLREAARRMAPRRRETLPLLTPEYAPGLEAYARHFFEALGDRLPHGTWLVLDNYQDCPEDARLQKLLPAGLGVLPPESHVLVLSRGAPPSAFARLVASGTMACLPEEELLLTAPEARAFARARTGTDPGRNAAVQVVAATGGWAAGMVLLLEARARLLPTRHGGEAGEQQLLFDYFATEIFERALPEQRRLLLATALLPEVEIAAAEGLAAEPRAAEILADLVRRNFFTVRLAGDRPRYRYHPLFRSFLQTMGRRAMAPEARAALVADTAQVLLGEGRDDDAAALLAREERWDALAALVRRHAETLAREGRYATIEGWLRALPAPLLEDDPWLSYWLGACSFASRDESRLHLERAYRLFKRHGDLTGMLVSWASYAETYLALWDEYASCDRWIAEMEELQARELAFPSKEIEAQVTTGMVGILMWRYSSHPRLAEWVERGNALLEDGSVSPVRRMFLAAQLAIYLSSYRGEYAEVARVLDRVRPLATAPDVSPLTEMMWWQVESHHRARLGDHRACLAAVERGLAAARERGMLGLTHAIAIQGVYGGLVAGDLDLARRYHGLALGTMGEALTNRGHHQVLGAWIGLVAGDLRSSEAHLRSALDLCARGGVDIGAPWIEAALAHVHVERGDAEGALEMLARCLAWSRRVGDKGLLHHSLLSTAYAQLRRERLDEALPPLREALRIGREQGYLVHFWIGWRRDVMARLLALALERGIEVEHARACILAGGLEPPDGAPAAWPWPVRVRTLGAFEVWRGEQRLAFAGKVQHRPLDLLRTVVALGGAAVRDEALTDALWPDAEGDAGDHALEMALLRLRRLLGDGAAVLHRDGRMGLDGHRCFVDALALTQVAERARRSMRRTEAAPEELEQELRAVADLYRGPLVTCADTGVDHAPPLRERLRGAVRSLAREAAPRLRAVGRGEAAAALLSQLNDADPELRLDARAGATPVQATT